MADFGAPKGRTYRKQLTPDLSDRKSYGTRSAKVREGKLPSGASYQVQREAVPRGKVTTSHAVKKVGKTISQLSRDKMVNHRGKIESKTTVRSRTGGNYNVMKTDGGGGYKTSSRMKGEGKDRQFSNRMKLADGKRSKKK